MASEVEELEAMARRLVGVASDRPEAASAERLARRLGAGQFVVSVVGEFNRGKSTLLNALVGAEVLPTGVLPLTTVATELCFGEPGAVVEHLDGTTVAIDPADVADFVTEERNPLNERMVALVRVRGRWPLLEPGVVLVDTPGIGSVHRHNTEAARAALADADGAVLVLSADAPLSEQERELLRSLAQRRAPTFFVLNRADHVAPGELDQLRRFVENVVCDDLGRKVRVFALSVRYALRARLAGRAPGEEAGEFPAFVSHIERFIAEDLVAARLAIARRELARLASSVRDAVAVERAAAQLDAARLAAQVERFRSEAGRQRQAFDDNRSLLARDVGRLAEELGSRLGALAAAAPRRHEPRLSEVAARAPRGQLEAELGAAIESAVRRTFEELREAEAQRTELAWQGLAQAFRARAQDRVNEVREAAAELFAVPLPVIALPHVDAERERFFYLFLHVGSLSEPFSRALRRLLPDAAVRRRALARARSELAREFDKHAGRARWDLCQRLDGVRGRFETAMRAELDDAIVAILAATTRAEGLRGQAAVHQAAKRAADDRQLAVAAELAGLIEDTS